MVRLLCGPQGTRVGALSDELARQLIGVAASGRRKCDSLVWLGSKINRRTSHDTPKVPGKA